MPPEVTPGTARIVKRVEWRRDATGLVEIFDEPTQKWFRFHPWTADVLSALERREPYAALVAASGQNDASVRRFLYGLHQAGHLDLDVPPGPASFAGGRYHTEAELGRGGVGIAWRCRDGATGRAVVVKRAWGYFTDAASADRLVRHEADVTRALDGVPGVVRLLDTFEEDGLLHLVRELVDGEPLSRVRVASDAVVPTMRAVGDILAAVHARGLLLLDVSPANFLLTKDGPVLIDAGLAQRVDERGQVRLASASGARGFVSPEARASLVADARSDVWALGRVGFALATGIMPLATWDEAELSRRLVDHPARGVVLALAKDDPAARPHDMRAALSLGSFAGS